jgi:predicted DCC family thiol-disulfide oxidoreductase YuxK
LTLQYECITPASKVSTAPRITNPPPKPLLIWDGDCHFCQRWIERWRAQTGDCVQYESSQQAAARFPEIVSFEFREAVVLVLPSGDVYRGAEAIFRALSFAQWRAWLLRAYERVPGARSICDAAYRFIAKRRRFASALTRLAWGRDISRPTYFTARNIFLRGLGLVYLIAFISLWVQIDGLIGERGILPARDFFSAVRAAYGTHAILALPSLCWLNASNAALHALCAVGVGTSALLIIGFLPIPTLLICFISYLSLTIAGQTFLSFQWDILLLETGFLAVLFAPWRLTLARAAPVSGVALFLLKFLLFKLMFMSGVVKLTSHDECWWNLTALDFHYWTQPLPTVFAWFADKSPEWFKKFSVAFCLVVEIAVPFFLWAPRRLRLTAATLLIVLQLAIAVTGNYCFFNLLTILLCFLLIDDATWRRFVGAVVGRAQSHATAVAAAPSAAASDRGYRLAPAIIIILPLNLWLCHSAIRPEAEWPRPLGVLYAYIEPFRIINGYGLFRVMTKEGPEIQVEGSADGIDWFPYDFKWKAGDVDRAPRWSAPHQPRLDWQMWFAALGNARQEIWFQRFMLRLLENERSVTGLLARNPFAVSRPRYVRAILYKYQFASSEEHRATGVWWKRRDIGEYFPEVTLNDFNR